jgi:hypothetical protein
MYSKKIISVRQISEEQGTNSGVCVSDIYACIHTHINTFSKALSELEVKIKTSYYNYNAIPWAMHMTSV